MELTAIAFIGLPLNLAIVTTKFIDKNMKKKRIASA